LSQARLPVWAVASSVLLLVMGFESFIFGVLVLLPSTMFADAVGKIVNNVTLPRMAMASAWILGFAIYTLMRQRQRAWLPILVFATVTLIIFNSDVSPIVSLIGAYAAVFSKQLIDLLGGSAAYGGFIAALAYSIIISWLTRALERGKSSLLVSAAIATVIAEGVSIMTLLLFGNLLNEIQSSFSGTTAAIVLLLVALAMLKDAKDALMKWDPALLAQLPLAFMIANAVLPDIARILAVLTYALAVFGAGAGLALRSRRLLVTASVIIGAFAPLAALSG